MTVFEYNRNGHGFHPHSRHKNIFFFSLWWLGAAFRHRTKNTRLKKLKNLFLLTNSHTTDNNTQTHHHRLDNSKLLRSAKYLFWIFFYTFTEASRGAVAQSVTVKSSGCGFDSRSRRWNIYLNLYFHLFALVSRQSAALSSVTQLAMPPGSGRKRRMECINTRFPLPTLLRTGYSVKLIYLIYLFFYKIKLHYKWKLHLTKNISFPLVHWFPTSGPQKPKYGPRTI